MNAIRRLLEPIPRVLSSTLSVVIFLILFVYLVIIGLIGLFVPSIEPTANVQLILGNYTNVLSALGAALAAGAGAVHVKSMKELHTKHDELTKSIDELHAKLDAVAAKL